MYMVLNRKLVGSIFILGVFSLSSSCTDLAPTTIVTPEPVIGDYFPLKVGNTWTYDFFYRYRTSGIERWDREGTSRWTVVDSVKKAESTEFYTQCAVSGTATYVRGYDGQVFVTPLVDTSWILITEDKNHFVTINRGAKWETFRFNPVAQGDTIKVFYPEIGTPDSMRAQYYCRNVGLVRSRWLIGGGGAYSTYDRYDLRDYSVQ